MINQLQLLPALKTFLPFFFIINTTTQTILIIITPTLTLHATAIVVVLSPLRDPFLLKEKGVFFHSLLCPFLRNCFPIFEKIFGKSSFFYFHCCNVIFAYFHFHDVMLGVIFSHHIYGDMHRPHAGSTHAAIAH